LRSSNGSLLTLLSDQEASGHGESVDLGVIDEAWAVDARTEQSVRPALLALVNGQILRASTAGTLRSTYWRSRVDGGRTAAEVGVTEDACYFEWSAPEDADPGDPRTWRAAMPALGHTIAERTVAADLAVMPLEEFCRSHLNMWVDAVGGWQVFREDDRERAAW
jgi:phage terminase large subunit-like protein